MATFLLAFGALFSIVNPLSGAFIFFGATRELDPQAAQARLAMGGDLCVLDRYRLAVHRRLRTEFFRHLDPGAARRRRHHRGDVGLAHAERAGCDRTAAQRDAEAAFDRRAPSRLAFYPLTMPLTTGPGTISVAISIGAGRPSGFHASLFDFFVETLAAVVLVILLVYGAYRHSARLADLIGPTGTTIIVRLSAFLLFCIGIQVLWNGAAELLGRLPFGTTGTG